MQTAAAAIPTEDQLVAVFDAPAPLTVGVEEEVMLLDPASLELMARSGEALERLGGDPRFKREFPLSQVEIVTEPQPSAAAVQGVLERARGDLVEALDGFARPACAGVHPFATGEGPVGGDPRHAHAEHEYGPVAVRQLVCALQVHVCVRGAERALAVYHGLRERLPLLAALAANGPWYEGRRTGLASMRPVICRLLPRQGVPPALRSWAEWGRELAWGQRAGGVPFFNAWWWELRPHPAHGTLEVRVPDAQTTTADAGAVVAVVHALAARLAARFDEEGAVASAAPTWRIEENRWSAVRHGLDGEMADLDGGRRRATRVLLGELLDELEGVARAQGAPAQLEHARSMLEANGARRQLEAADARMAAAVLADGFVARGGG